MLKIDGLSRKPKKKLLKYNQFKNKLIKVMNTKTNLPIQNTSNKRGVTIQKNIIKKKTKKQKMNKNM